MISLIKILRIFFQCFIDCGEIDGSCCEYIARHFSLSLVAREKIVAFQRNKERKDDSHDENQRLFVPSYFIL